MLLSRYTGFSFLSVLVFPEFGLWQITFPLYNGESIFSPFGSE
jgi:hypothetical protein